MPWILYDIMVLGVPQWKNWSWMPSTCGLTHPLFNYSGDHKSHEYYGAKGVLMNECSVRMDSPTPWLIILTWSGITQGARNRSKQFTMVPQRLSHGLALLEMEHLGCSNAVPNCARTLLSTPDRLHGAVLGHVSGTMAAVSRGGTRGSTMS
mgnify:CR=1 FL=1